MSLKKKPDYSDNQIHFISKNIIVSTYGRKCILFLYSMKTSLIIKCKTTDQISTVIHSQILTI